MVVGEYWLLPVTGVGLFLITQVSMRFILSCQVAFIIWCLVRLGANRESHLVWGSSTYPTLCSCDGYANLYVAQSLVNCSCSHAMACCYCSSHLMSFCYLTALRWCWSRSYNVFCSAMCFAPLQTDAFPTTSYQCSESLLPLMHSVWVIISLFSLQDKVVPLVMTWRKVGR